MPMAENMILVAHRGETIEMVHGVPVADPYRWLEDADSRETRDWTAAQNAYTEALLSAVPGRAVLEARLHELFSVGVVGQPAVRGRQLFYLKREGAQAQPVLYTRNGLDEPEQVVVDPNAIDPSGLTALDWWVPSLDGRLVAYGTSLGGDEWSTLQVVEVEDGRVLPDAIPRARYSSVAWQPDGGGFFYTRYPEPGTVPPGEEEYHSHAYHHRLGDDSSRDPKVFGEGRSPQDMIVLRTSMDGRWLVATAFQGWARSEVYVRDLSRSDLDFRPVVEDIDALFSDAIPTATRIYLRTNWQATNYRIVSVDPLNPMPKQWETVVPEREHRVIEGFTLVDGRIVTHELERATSRLRVYQRDGTTSYELPLPSLGTIDALDGEECGSWVVVGFESFATPASSFVYDLETCTHAPLAPLPLPAGFDPESIEVNQVSFPSRDGTLISMFLIHRRGMVRSGNTPTMLTGYGGFNISLGPYYAATTLAWAERGGMVAIPNLRGGGEYGEAWHRAGMLQNKQNDFDDFIAAADWLVAEEHTRPERLAIEGGSNGGLLVGAALTQRPELFRAVVCAVPLLDMVRYHHFRIAKLWIPEYGSADDPEAFHWLIAYSPYHHAVEGTCYPATLLTTGEEDSRVDPMHARKMAALLQWATSCAAERPILLRAETEAGHGAGKPLAKRVAEAADSLGFIGWQLGVGWDQ